MFYSALQVSKHPFEVLPSIRFFIATPQIVARHVRQVNRGADWVFATTGKALYGSLSMSC